MRPVKLAWQGPFQIPGLRSAISRVSDLSGPHVYFTTQKYSGRTIIYVGQASDFLKRMQQHFSAMLGFGSWLRDADGCNQYKVGADEYWRILDGIENNVGLAVAETKRLEFFCAACRADELKAIEAALISRAKGRERAGNYDCDNTRRETTGADDAAIQIDMTAHQKWPGAQSAVELAFGDKPIIWGRTVEGEGLE